MLFFDAPRVCGELLYNVEIHQRFAAEEIDLEIAPAAGIRNEKIERLFADLVAHESPVAVVFALAREAVGAVEIAGMGNVEAERLDDPCGALRKLLRDRLIGVLRKEQALFLKLPDAFPAFRDLLFRYGKTLRKGGHELLPRGRLICADELIGELVHGVNAAGAGIYNYIQPAELITMDHERESFLSKNAARRRHFGAMLIYLPFGLCFHTAGLRCRSWSCKRTGKKSGIRRSRRASRFRKGAWPSES